MRLASMLARIPSYPLIARCRAGALGHLVPVVPTRLADAAVDEVQEERLWLAAMAIQRVVFADMELRRRCGWPIGRCNPPHPIHDRVEAAWQHRGALQAELPDGGRQRALISGTPDPLAEGLTGEVVPLLQERRGSTIEQKHTTVPHGPVAIPDIDAEGREYRFLKVVTARLLTAAVDGPAAEDV